MPQPQGALAKSFIELAYKVGRPIPAKQEVLNLRHVAFFCMKISMPKKPSLFPLTALHPWIPLSARLVACPTWIGDKYSNATARF